jgi:hypothetical protein
VQRIADEFDALAACALLNCSTVWLHSFKDHEAPTTHDRDMAAGKLPTRWCLSLVLPVTGVEGVTLQNKSL